MYIRDFISNLYVHDLRKIGIIFNGIYELLS
jgi:hypothetical protein